MLLEKTLANGLDLIVKPTNAPVVAVQVWVDVGSIDETPKEAGYCHFLEHMLFKGTQKRTTSQIAGSIEGAGGEMNAFTSFEYTVYHITLSNERWKIAHEILADMVLGSAFYPKEFNPEKEVILEEIKRGEDSPERQLYQGLYSQLYGTSGYGRPVIGHSNIIKNTSAAGLKSFWKKWYSPSLMTLVVCGDVDAGDVEKEALKHWGRANGKPLRKRRRDLGYANNFASLKKTAQREFPVNEIKWVASLPGCSIHDDDLVALDLSSMVLGQGESSRLYQKLYREEQLVTSIGSGIWAPAGKGMYTFDVATPVEKAGQFRSSLFREINRFCDEGPTKEELDRMKTQLETDRIYSSQSMDGLANRLGYLKTALGNTRYDLEYLSEARELTPGDVRDVAAKYLDWKGAREFGMFPKGYASKEFWSRESATKAPSKAKPTSARKSEHKLVHLSNGIDLALFPRNDLPIVSLQGCFLGGLRAEDKSTAGMGNILSDVWEKGPKGWDSKKFAEYLEGRGSRIESFTGRNSVGLGFTTITHHLTDVLSLFTDTLFNPEFSAEEFELARSSALEDIRTYDDHVSRVAVKLFLENMFEGHPYGHPMIGNAESVAGLTPAKMREFFTSKVASAPVAIGISGKFNSDQVVAAFEGLKRNFDPKSPLKNAIPMGDIKGPRLVEVKKNREQAHIVVGFRGIELKSEERHALRVLLNVMGGQSGRLFTEIRDKQGLCYTVSPMSFEGLEPGYVGVYMACDPAKTKQGLASIWVELEKLMRKPIPALELKRAKEFLSGRHHMEIQLNSAIANSSAFNTLFGLPYDEHLKLAAILQKVTPQALQKIAQKIFGSPSVTSLVI